MKPEDPKSSEHPESLLLSYLEDSLAPEDRAAVQSHIETCADCSAKLDGVSRMIANLKTNQEAFCPAPWVLYDFICSGEDPTGEVVKHIEKCPSCREEAEACKPLPPNETVPAELWAKGKDLIPKKSMYRKPVEPSEQLSGLLSRLTSMFNIPVMAVATATAVFLIVVFYPHGTTGPVMGLSSVSWDRTGDDNKLMSPVKRTFRIGPGDRASERPRVATIIFFDDPNPPFKQEQIDLFYRVLKPTSALSARFDFLTPKRVKDVISKGAIKTDSRNDIIKGLHEKLGVSRAIFLTIASKGDRFDVESELIETATGNTVRKKTRKGVSTALIPSRIHEASSLLR